MRDDGVNSGDYVEQLTYLLFLKIADEKTRQPFNKESKIPQGLDCDVHTLLPLPTGIFCAQGVKANVLFFDRKPASETAWTEKLWIYDLRTNQHFTIKTNPLKLEDLQDFIKCYNAENGKTAWRPNASEPSAMRI